MRVTTATMHFRPFQGYTSTPEDYIARQQTLSDPVQDEKKRGMAQSFLLPNGRPDYIRLILTSRVYDIASETPLTRAASLSSQLKCNVMLKREDLQPISSFEVRGAYNKIVHLDPEFRWRGLVANSTGSHAEGVAFSSRYLRIPSSIVMPVDTPEFKKNNVLRLGASVVISGADSDEAMKEVQRMETMYGIAHIPTLDDPYVIAGQGTVGMEILRQTSPEHLEAVFCSILDGSLIAGMGVYIKRVTPHVKIIGVRSSDSKPGEKWLATGKPDLYSGCTVANAAGGETFMMCQEVIDEIETVTMDQTFAAVKDVFEDTGCIMDHDGALAVAGLKQWVKRNSCHRHRRGLVAIATSANTNFDSLRFLSGCTSLSTDERGCCAN